jgi:CBS domain containing-hemolysin-like protein
MIGLIGILLALLGATLCAAAVRVVTEIAWHELEEYCRRKKRPELFSRIYDGHESIHISAEILQQILVAISFVLLFAWWPFAEISQWKPYHWLGLVVSCGLTLVLVNSWIPWAIARASAVGFLYRSWPWWKGVSPLVYPLLAAGELFTSLFARASGQPEEEDEEEAFEDEILSMVSEAEQDGYIEAEAREMIEGVIELGDTEVRSIMTPRSRVYALQVPISWEEMMNRVVEAGRSRVPVYRDSLDQIIGLLYTKDLLKESLRPEPKRRPLQKLLRKPLFVPEQTRLDEMLRQFLHCRTHMAIVQDEYGGLAGVVTIEDVLEEIVGEIVDESDKERSTAITLLNEFQADVEGSVYIYQLNEALGLGLPEDDHFDTVSGLIMHHIKEIPRPGHELLLGNVQFNIQDANRRQILSVRVTRLSDPA